MQRINFVPKKKYPTHEDFFEDKQKFLYKEKNGQEFYIFLHGSRRKFGKYGTHF
jgi:hypothetical protein